MIANIVTILMLLANNTFIQKSILNKILWKHQNQSNSIIFMETLSNTL